MDAGDFRFGFAPPQSSELIRTDPLKNGSRPVKLQTLTVLWDRIFGKPKQEIGVSGGLLHAHTRDPRLASLSKEALEELARAYDDIVAVPSVLEVAQDAPQNQTESRPAIEEVTVEPSAD